MRYIELNFNRNKFSNILLIFFLFLLLFILMFALDCKKSFYNFVDYMVNNYYTARQLEVVNIDLTYDEMYEKIDSMEHILGYYVDNFRMDLDIVNLNSFPDNKLHIFPGFQGNMPISVYGRNILNDDEMICPYRLAKTGTSGFDTEYIDMKKYLGKTINLKNDVYSYEIWGERPKIIATNNYSFKIVGLYDYSAFGDQPYYCYMKSNVVDQLVNSNSPVFSSSYYPDDYLTDIGKDTGIFPYIVVFVDNNKNVSSVIQKFTEMGFECDTVLNIDFSFLHTFSVIFSIFVVIFILIIFIIFYILLMKNVKKRFNELRLLFAIGYNHNLITNILFLNYAICFGLGFFLAIIFNFLFNFLINKFISQNISLIGFNINIYWLGILLLFLLFILIFVIYYFILKKRIVKLLGSDYL